MSNTKLQNKKPNVVGLRELRESMDVYVDRVSKGESFLVLRKSQPVFRMEPVDEFGDEGNWENFDFRDKNGRGTPIEKMIEMVKKSIAKDARQSKILQQTERQRKGTRA